MTNKIDRSKSKKWIELTRNEKFINGNIDIFDLLAQRNKPKYTAKENKKPLTHNL